MYSLSRILHRSHRLGVASSRAAYSRLKVDKEGVVASSTAACENCQYFQKPYYTKSVPMEFAAMRRALSSNADAKDTGEASDQDNGVSEPKTAASMVNTTEAGADDDSLSEAEESGNEDVDEGTFESESEAETDLAKKESNKAKNYSVLYKVIVSAPGNSVKTALDKWLNEGNSLSRKETSLAMHNLRKRKMFFMALKFSEWLEANKQLEFIESDYVCHLDLIAKVHGLHKAEIYMTKIPEYTGDVMHRTLLGNCVVTNNVKKAEEYFKKMQDLKLPISLFAFNQLLLLYRRHDKDKIPAVLSKMEEENVAPSKLTYKILIDAKGICRDIDGIDRILESMKAEGVEPDLQIQISLAKSYTVAGLKDRAIAVLKELEGEGVEKKPWTRKTLMTMYAELGKADEVARIWNSFGQDPMFEECMAAVEAFGKLKKIKEAEVAFEMLQKIKRPSSKAFNAMLKAYAENKMLSKVEDLVKQMEDNIHTPMAWDVLMKLYVEVGEIEKADSILDAMLQNSKKLPPSYNSYLLMLYEYSKQGNVHNSEKMFHMLRKAGYNIRHRQYEALVLAYVNAKAPAYGVADRMRSDKLIPNPFLATKLAQVDPFKKNTLSDLLD